MNYIVVKPTKSVGIAILLSLLFGPIGLFYATVTGGIVMTLLPVIAFILLSLSAALLNTNLFLASFSVILIFGGTYWIIAIVWAVLSVRKYNANLVAGSNSYSEQFYNARSLKSESLPPVVVTKKDTTDNPSFQEWKTKNPHRSINDYYSQYPVSRSELQTKSNIDHVETESRKSQSISFPVIILGSLTLLIVLALVLFFDPGSKSFSRQKAMKFFSGLNSQHKVIEEQIKTVYFGLVNGAYSAEGMTGVSPEDLPFYNSDITTLMVMGFVPFGMLNGPVQIEPINIVVHSIKDEEAIVSYDLVKTDGKKQKSVHIQMTLKKISGKWKLDGQKFFPFK